MAKPYEPTEPLTVTDIDPDLSRRQLIAYLGGLLASTILCGGSFEFLRRTLSMRDTETDIDSNLLDIRKHLFNVVDTVNKDPGIFYNHTVELGELLEGIFLHVFPHYGIGSHKISGRIHSNNLWNNTMRYTSEVSSEPVLLYLDERNEYNVLIMNHDQYSLPDQVGSYFLGQLAATMPFLHTSNHPIGVVGGNHTITGFNTFRDGIPITTAIDSGLAVIEFTELLRNGLGYSDVPAMPDVSNHLLAIAEENGFNIPQLLLARHQSDHLALVTAFTGQDDFDRGLNSLVELNNELEGM